MSLRKLSSATCLPADLFLKREPYVILARRWRPTATLLWAEPSHVLPPPKNQTDRDQQRIQIGKTAQTKHGSLFSMLSSSCNAPAIDRDEEYRETRLYNDSRLVTLVTTIDENLR